MLFVLALGEREDVLLPPGPDGCRLCGSHGLLHYILFSVNIMKKHNMKQLLVESRGMVPLVNGEAASSGDAALATNLREGERCLSVTGEVPVVGQIGASERLLLITGGHSVTASGRQVKIDGETVLDPVDGLIGAHLIGQIVVIVAAGGLTYLAPTGDGGWRRLDPSAAVPGLSFSAPMMTSSASIPAYTFAAPYGQWREPLADVDTAALAGMLSMAWRALHGDLAAEGRHTAPMLVRWAVRLMDDTYLWVSDPVRVGDATLANADRISAVVDSGSNGFYGTQAATLTMSHYRLAITVASDIAAEWLPLVKSIDVLATSEAQLLNGSQQLDYRCLTRTTGNREYVLEMGLSRRGADAIAAQLRAAPWRLVATAPAAAHLSAADFVEPVEPMTLTAAECAALGRGMALTGVVCSAAAGGRLYCCAGGDVVVSVAGNALVEEHRRKVLGANPLSMAVVTRPLYSGGFGRYPVYVFSDDGIYAIPQSANGKLGEARLVNRMVIHPDVPPVEASDGIWFISRHGHLCRLDGSRVEVVHRNADCVALAWCNAYQELWMLPSQGVPVVRMKRGTMSRRTVAACQLYSDPRHAVGVTASGQVLDLEQEVPSTVEVEWRSHPIAVDALMGQAVKRVVWHVKGSEVNLSLKVQAQRGIMAQDCDVSVMTVSGAVNQPLAAPTMAIRGRTVTLAMTGMASSGTMLMPTLLYCL